MSRIIDELNRDLDEFRRHRLEPADMTPLHRLHLELVRFMRTEPPWSRREFMALIDHADQAAARADAAASRAVGPPIGAGA